MRMRSVNYAALLKNCEGSSAGFFLNRQHHSNTVWHRSKIDLGCSTWVCTKGVRYWMSEGFEIPEESAARREIEEAYLTDGFRLMEEGATVPCTSARTAGRPFST